jgi:protoporphyrinogen/coproporphyrinogen III oxidase
MSTAVNNVVVVGGGVAGLAAAHALQTAGRPYTLIEASDRFGGLVQTVEQDGCRIEFGPDAFITRKPWAYDLAQALGLAGEMVGVQDTRERIYVLVEGRLEPLPEGLRLLVPTKFGPFWASNLLSTAGKLRLLADLVIPKKVDNHDESLAEFVTRRMGREALERLADPLLGGVYNAEMDRQSILATFPQYRVLEAKHGSLIRGMRAAAAKAQAPDKPVLVSFREGMGQFIRTLAASLTGDLRLNTRVKTVTENTGTNGVTLSSAGHYRVLLDDGEVLEAQGLVMATPANVTAHLVRAVATDTSALLDEIRYEGVGSVALAYRVGDIPRPLDAYGIVIPSTENRDIDGMQWSSSKWDDRAPEGVALVRVFFGGPHTRYMLDEPDEALLARVRDELLSILGITADPLHTTIGRWHDAYPQYDVGHKDLVDKIMRSRPKGLMLAGNAYYGVGLPDTINSAQLAVRGLLEPADPR